MTVPAAEASEATAAAETAPPAAPNPFDALDEAPGAAERTDLLLGLIAGANNEPLSLPSLNGRRANLAGVDLSPDALRARVGEMSDADAPAWWDAQNERVILREASLRGADLKGANLEKADLSGADLAGADLSGAQLGGANLEDALLEEAVLENATLRFAQLPNASLEGANGRHADLWGANLAGAQFDRADLRRATLTESDGQRADFGGADLRGSFLNRANLSSAGLVRADLRESDVTGTNLENADLHDARLDELDLTRCASIAHVHLHRASLRGTRLEREQLGGRIGEEAAGAFDLARRGYLALERCFVDLGEPEASRWAYRKRRRMQKQESRKQARAAWRERRFGEAAGHAAVYAGDQLVEWVCDYGESVPRVLASMLFLDVAFMLIYGLTGSVVQVASAPGGATVRTPTTNLVDLAVFSLLAMTTSGSPAVALQPRNELVHFLTGLEALLGIGLTGLLGFVVGNRIRR